MKTRLGDYDDYHEVPTYEVKQFPTFIKATDEAQGIVEHLIAIIGNRDQGGDRITPGAFTKTLVEHGLHVKVLDQHGADSVTRIVGRPLALREIGLDELPPEVLQYAPDATGGLLAKTQYALDTARGHDVFHLIKGGFARESSIGYDPVQVEVIEETGKDGKLVTTRLLKQIRLWEYSNVIFGMNRATTVLSAKADEGEAKAASGSTRLPLASRERAWDAAAAQGRIRTWAEVEDAPNARYGQAFFWVDSENRENFTAYKLPFADVIDGELTAIPRGIFAVAAVLQGSRGGTTIPEADQAAIKRRVSAYYSRMRSEFDDDGITPPWEKALEGDMEDKAGRRVRADRVDQIKRLRDAMKDLADFLKWAEYEDEAPDESRAASDNRSEQKAGPSSDETPTSTLLEQLNMEMVELESIELELMGE